MKADDSSYPVSEQLTFEASVQSPNPKPRPHARQSAVQKLNAPHSPSSIVGEFPPHTPSLSLSDRNVPSNFAKSNISSLVQPLTNSAEYLQRQQLSQHSPSLQKNDHSDSSNQMYADHTEDPNIDPVIQQMKARLRKNGM